MVIVVPVIGLRTRKDNLCMSSGYLSAWHIVTWLWRQRDLSTDLCFVPIFVTLEKLIKFLCLNSLICKMGQYLLRFLQEVH